MPKRHFLIPMWLAALAVLAVACGGGSSAPGDGSQLSVVTTIYPLTYFTERIGGDRVQVTSLIKPGVEAHDFEPSPGDIRTIAGADVLIYNHRAFEAWIPAAVEAAGSDDLVAVESADLPDEAAGADQGQGDSHDHEGGIDPHVWLNPLEAVEQARAIESALSQADPEGADTYRRNADALVAELEALDGRIADALASCRLDHMVVSHLAYGHLAERYGIEQIGLAGLSPEFESGPQQVTAIVNEMRELGITHILQEPIADDRLARTVAAETGATVLPLHPLESLTTEQVEAGDTYFTVMERNLESLRTALGCG